MVLRATSKIWFSIGLYLNIQGPLHKIILCVYVYKMKMNQGSTYDELIYLLYKRFFFLAFMVDFFTSTMLFLHYFSVFCTKLKHFKFMKMLKIPSSLKLSDCAWNYISSAMSPLEMCCVVVAIMLNICSCVFSTIRCKFHSLLPICDKNLIFMLSVIVWSGLRVLGDGTSFFFNENE